MNLEVISSRYNTTELKGRSIEYIVVHYTAGGTSKAGTAAANARYFGGGDRRASADFFVDDGGVVQFNPDIRNRYTWHCGGSSVNTVGGAFNGKCRNANSIGVELCSSHKSGKMSEAMDEGYYFTDEVLKNGVELVASLAKEYNIPEDHIIRHFDVTGKLCPGVQGWLYDDDAYYWDAFKAKVHSEMYAPNLSDWAADAWQWAKTAKITDGTRPQNFVTREELVTMLYRYHMMKL